MSWEWGKQAGSKGSKLRVRGASWEWGEQARSKGSKLGGTLGPTEVVGIPKHTLDLHCALPPLSQLGVRGAKWEQGKGALAQLRWWAPQNLPPQVVGTPNHTPWSWLCPMSAQTIGSEGSEMGARGGTLGPTEVVGTLKIGPYKWWGPQSIPLDLHYTLPLLSQLGVRGASWEWGEGPLPKLMWWAPQNLPPQVVRTPKHTLNLDYALPPLSQLGVRGVKWEQGEGALAQLRWWAPQNLPPQMVGTPKHTSWSQLCPMSAQTIGSEGSEMGARGGTLGPTELVGTPRLAPHKWWALQNISLDLHYALLLFSPLGIREQAESKPFPKRGGGHPKTFPHMWWEPQNIPLDLHYLYLCLVHWEQRERVRSKWEREGVSWEQGEWAGSKRKQAGRDPCPNKGGGHPKNCPHKWWGPQNIPLNLDYALPPLSQLGVREVSWEWGEGPLVQQNWCTP